MKYHAMHFYPTLGILFFLRRTVFQCALPIMLQAMGTMLDITTRWLVWCHQEFEIFAILSDMAFNFSNCLCFLGISLPFIPHC